MSLPVCSCARARHQHGTRLMYDAHKCPCEPCAEANAAYSRRRRTVIGALPACDCPRADHVHGTRIMYNRHQCPCTPCADANRDYAQARQRNAKAAALPVCDCTRASVPHEHGTRGMYNRHRCPCTPCREANRAYNRAYTRPDRKDRAVVAMADAGKARERVAVLRAAGMTMAEIADACAVNRTVLDFAVYGYNGKPPAKIRATTVAALHAITYKDAAAVELKAGRKVNPDIPRRQVQSLYSLGWCATDIAARAGIEATGITSLLRGNGTIEKVRAGVDRAYTELCGSVPPEDTARQRASASLARNRAAVNGWTIDTAEDHLYARAA